MRKSTKTLSAPPESIRNRRFVRPTLVALTAGVLPCGANPSLRQASAATRNDLSQAACNSPLNADVSTGSARLVRIVHPFHPFSGRQLICVGERHNRSGKRLLLRVDDRTICSVPQQWTDMAAPDPEVVMGRGRGLFRVADLVELARLVTSLSTKRRSEKPAQCKVKYAADVKQFVPQ
jgi:hypothetical protein